MFCLDSRCVDCVTCVCQIDLGTRPQVMRRPPLSADDWSKHQDPEGRMTNIPHLKQAIFKGARSLIVYHHHPLTVFSRRCVCVIMCHVTLQGLCHAVRKEAWKFLLGYFPWDSTLEERKVQHRAKTYGHHCHQSHAHPAAILLGTPAHSPNVSSHVITCYLISNLCYQHEWNLKVVPEDSTTQLRAAADSSGPQSASTSINWDVLETLSWLNP